MKTIGAYEAKTHLPALLKSVERGERFTIAKHGKPVAVLVPAEEGPAADGRAVVAEMRAFRRGRKLGRISLRKLIEEGRR